MTPKDWVCMRCKNYLRGNTCRAFLNGIPEEIYSGRNKHIKPLKGQGNKIVYEPDREG